MAVLLKGGSGQARDRRGTGFSPLATRKREGRAAVADYRIDRRGHTEDSRGLAKPSKESIGAVLVGLGRRWPARSCEAGSITVTVAGIGERNSNRLHRLLTRDR